MQSTVFINLQAAQSWSVNAVLSKQKVLFQILTAFCNPASVFAYLNEEINKTLTPKVHTNSAAECLLSIWSACSPSKLHKYMRVIE